MGTSFQTKMSLQKDSILFFPFRYVNCPNVVLDAPEVPNVHPTILYGFILATFYLVVSGFIFDMIRSPPPFGMKKNADGSIEYNTIMPYQLNQQYTVEGFLAGTWIVGGGLFMVFLMKLQTLSIPKQYRGMSVAGSLIGVVVFYNLLMTFLRFKVS